MKKTVTITIGILLALVFLTTGFNFGTMAENAIGTDSAYNKGYNEALDTMQRIMDKQIRKKDSCITRVRFKSKQDTVTYELSYDPRPVKK